MNLASALTNILKQKMKQIILLHLLFLLFLQMSGCGWAMMKESQNSNSSEIDNSDQGIVLYRSIPSTQLTKDATPIVRVSGVSQGDVVRIYTDSNCQNVVGTATATSANAFVTLTTNLPEGANELHVQVERQNDLFLTCSSNSISYTVDTIAPVTPSSVNMVNPIAGLTYSLNVTYELSNLQTGESASLFTSSDCTGELLGSAFSGNDGKAQVTVNMYNYALASSFPNYLVKVYGHVVDAAGNISGCSTNNYDYIYAPWFSNVSLHSHTCQQRETYQHDIQVATNEAYILIGNPDDRGNPPYVGGCPSSSKAGDQYGSLTLYAASDWNSKLYIAGTISGGLFGYDIASNGYETVVSAPGASHVYLYQGIDQLNDFTASNFDAADRFGESIDYSGNTVIVGSPFEDANQSTITNGSGVNSDDSLSDSGAVYVYYRTGNSWDQQAYIKAWNAAENMHFGSEVKIDQNRIAVLAHDQSCAVGIQNTSTPSSSMNNCTNRGAIFIYKRDTNLQWTLEAYIKPSQINYNFLSGLAFENNRIAVQRDDGKVELYLLDQSWQLEAVLTPSNHSSIIDLYEGFGKRIEFSGNQLAILSQYDKVNSNAITNSNTISLADTVNLKSGAVYIFEYASNQWTQVAHLKNGIDAWSDGVQKNQMTAISFQSGLLYAVYSPTGTSGENISSIVPLISSFYAKFKARVVSGLPREKSNLTVLNVGVDYHPGIASDEKYKYKLGLKNNTNCSDTQGYSTSRITGISISDSLASFADGDQIRLCILGSYFTTPGYEQMISNPTIIDWTKDLSY